MKTILYTWFAVLLFGMAAVSCGDDDTKNNDTTGITGSSWKASETVGADRTTKKYTFKASANWVAQSDKPEWCKILTSSSEAVINTLRGLDGFTVKLIGEKTNGKNVGMEVSKFTVGNYSYELAPISFQGYNAKQVTVDKNGLAVDTACEEWDGELKDYGDRSEPMLAAALSQITGQRSASVSGTRSTAPGVRPATDIALPDLSNRPNGMIVFLPAAEE